MRLRSADREMGTDKVIRLSGVTKIFSIPHVKSDTLFRKLTGFIKKNLSYETLYALNHIDISVKKGEIIGIIGPNASGKTTLLRIIAGIIQPTKGNVKVLGRIAPLLGLGVGFESELTAKENIIISGIIMGLRKKEIKSKIKDIIEFSCLEKFIDMPLKNYSAGMYSRLAFSMALQTKGDIFLIDEILSVGDEEFQEKCLSLFRDLVNDRKTILFVSHDLSAVKKLCNRVILLEEGSIIKDGSPEEVVELYEKRFHSEKNDKENEEIRTLSNKIKRIESDRKAELNIIKNTLHEGNKQIIIESKKQIEELNKKILALEKDIEQKEVKIRKFEEDEKRRNGILEPGRWGNQKIEINNITLISQDNKEVKEFNPKEDLLVRIYYSSKKEIKNPMFGIAIHTSDGILLIGPNNIQSGKPFNSVKDSGHVDCVLRNHFLPGKYLLSAAIHSANNKVCYDYHNKAISFTIKNPSKDVAKDRSNYDVLYDMANDVTSKKSYGSFDIEAKWELNHD